MTDRPKIPGAIGGAVALSALALALGACCVTPWAVGLPGVGGAVTLARLAGLRSPVVTAPLVPAFPMHQLGVLPHTAQFPHLDARVFAAKVRAMMDGISSKAVSQ